MKQPMKNMSDLATEFGRRGGKKSAEKRLSNLSKKEISEKMRKIRLSREEKKKFQEEAEDMVASLNSSMQE
jgi:hypothetical protein